VLVVSLVLATSTPLVWTLTTPPRDAGTLPTAVVSASPRPVTADARDSFAAARDVGSAPRVGDVAAPAGDRAPRVGDAALRAGDVAAPDGVTGAADPPPATRSARIADLDQAPTAVPERLRIEEIDVEAPIVTVGVEDDGEMEVPEDVGDIGWYRHGPAPGEPGTAVVAGHVDSREQGRGAFFDLRRVDVGARVEVTDSAGDVQRFEVVARRTYDKATLPADELFSRTGPSQLVLITCGGDFDREAGSYRENVVLYAQPSTPPQGG
jgi:sortase (surface protein transpeptidase)